MTEKILRFPTTESTEEQQHRHDRGFAVVRLASAQVFRTSTSSRDHQEPNAQTLAGAVGQNIGTWQERCGLTQDELAWMVGCRRSSVSRWESASRLPSLLQEMLHLGCTLHCLWFLAPESGGSCRRPNERRLMPPSQQAATAAAPSGAGRGRG